MTLSGVYGGGKIQTDCHIGVCVGGGSNDFNELDFLLLANF